MSSPDQHDAEHLLAGWWSSYTAADDPNDELSPQERLAVTAPYGNRWPGLAAPGTPRHGADQHADQHADDRAEDLLRTTPGMRLGLVAADRGADALTRCGWQGAANYTNDTAELSAALRSWEDRFGGRVIAAGFSELYLSIAAPPTTTDHAQAVAAEHFAFCPDNTWQGTHPFTLTSYAERLLNAPTWSFWWD